MGRPRLRWWEDFEKDLWKMKVQRWRRKKVVRVEWVSIIKVPKALRGMQSHEGRKYYENEKEVHTHHRLYYDKSKCGEFEKAVLSTADVNYTSGTSN
jgi:hypothetical protein